MPSAVRGAEELPHVVCGSCLLGADLVSCVCVSCRHLQEVWGASATLSLRSWAVVYSFFGENDFNLIFIGTYVHYALCSFLSNTFPLFFTYPYTIRNPFSAEEASLPREKPYQWAYSLNYSNGSPLV